jgi:hypothetical protein
MNRWKASLTCSYCSKIFQDPIQLPCNHSLCKEHLVEKDVVKKNRIQCGECKQDYEVIGNEFKPKLLVQKLLERRVYLSEEEVALKKNIEDSIRTYFQLYEEYTLDSDQLKLDAHEHLQEIRFQLDEHREALKTKIDDIYMDMIDKTKKFEASYLKSLEDKLSASLKSFETKSLEHSLKETEETFRNPNVLIESIRKMQSKQTKAIEDLILKLDEQSEERADILCMNEFKPNVQFSQDSFGHLRINEYIKDPFESRILYGNQPCDLIKLCGFSLRDKWTLLYRGTRDGFGAADFHSKCDGHKNTLTILMARDTSYKFGGFTSIEWDTSCKYKHDQHAFLFSLTNRNNKPSKMKQIKINHSIYCHPDFGPIFGSGHDLAVCDSSFVYAKSYSRLGSGYKHPDITQSGSYLAGSIEFQLSEIEVYQKI